MGKARQIERAYTVSDRGCRISRVGNTRSNMPTGYQYGLQDLTDKEHQIVHAYVVSRWGCRTSRVRHIRSNLPTRYQVGVAGSHGLETTDRTCLLGIRR